ncbi:MAG TPA: hypothetical protein VGR72_07225 [Candidatus Acidoferrales bacterium]|nr:hypothetical protein [Candidatus Acidoferrales bacterium]
MSRGAQQRTQQLTQQQLKSQNQLISEANQEGLADRQLLMPGIEQLINNPGYTPAQQSAIEQGGMGAARTAFDALRETAANRVARTNNVAGFGALDAELGRQEAQNLAQQARQNQIQFANEQIGQRMAGLGALGQTYGIDTNLLGRAMGVPPELLNVQEASAKSGGGIGSFLGAVGLGLGSLFG